MRKGAQVQAIGCSRGGRNTKLHAITDKRGRPLDFLLTPGRAAECNTAEARLTHLPLRCIVLADRAYDTNPVRQLIEAQGTAPNIPSKVTRIWKSCFSPVLYKGRNAIERKFCKLKNFRRIARRYDKLADDFLASVHLVAALTW